MRRRPCQELDLRGPESRDAADKTASRSIARFAWFKQRSNLGQEVSVPFASGTNIPSVEEIISPIGKAKRLERKIGNLHKRGSS